MLHNEIRTPIVGIVDYGAGNLTSVLNAVKKVAKNSYISSNPEELIDAEYIILPGVGTFSDGIKSLENKGLDKLLKEFFLTNKPILGICLGMQMLLTEGYEGGVKKGLGLIDGYVHKLKYTNNSRIPHIGWNDIYGNHMKDIPIFNNIEPHSSCYFVHSYHAVFSQETKSIYTDFYGSEIVAGFQKDNLFATQFHPEKSQHVGIQILKNFLSIEKV